VRIIAGRWRGKRLVAPTGAATRPTADRTRQSVFDMLMHAPWAGRALLDGAAVLDAFAGTGAMGLEALSRGAASAVFMENGRTALRALAANIAACQAGSRASILAVDATRPPPGRPQRVAFLDPPYNHDLVKESLHALRESGWIVSDTIIVAEARRSAPDEVAGSVSGAGLVLLDERMHGVAKITVWRGQ
jgi:16S rRNA (guanine966-N2)-methyltransferase